jgi:hypothetical protein
MTIIKQPISSIQFSQDGLTVRLATNPIISSLNIAHMSKDGFEVHLMDWPELANSFESYYSSLPAESGQIPSSDCQVEPSQAIKKSRALQTAMSISTLVNHETQTQQVIPGGSVTIGFKLVAQLPRLQQGYETHISLLPSTENDKWVRMVWNKGAQDTYSIQDYQSPHVPSVIYRRQGTIENRYDLFSGVKRQRLQ